MNTWGWWWDLVTSLSSSSPSSLQQCILEDDNLSNQMFNEKDDVGCGDKKQDHVNDVV